MQKQALERKRPGNSLNYYELEPENNHFYTVLADITHRCNMRCSNCYIPNRKIPDMNKHKLFALLKKLPFKCEIRLIGAEPTMREDLPEIISTIRRLSHRPVLVTNGLKLAQLSYVRTLKKSGLFFAGISLNGGSNDEVYKKMDGGSYARKKMRALENLAAMGFVISTNTIIVRDLNERVPFEIYSKLKHLKVRKGFIRIKNIGFLGRYMKPEHSNCSFKEMVQMTAHTFRLDEKWILTQNVINGYKEKKSVLFPLEKNKHQSIYMKITDWSSGEDFGCPDPNSQRRGRITEDFKIAPCFEHIKVNEFGY